jgi:hypothetical protein
VLAVLILSLLLAGVMGAAMIVLGIAEHKLRKSIQARFKRPNPSGKPK